MSPGRFRIPLLHRLAVLLPLLLGAALLAPASVSAAPAAAAGSATSSASADPGLRGDYYRSSNGTALDFATYTGTRIDSSLHVDDLLPALRAYTGTTENVAVRWTGRLEVPANGVYTFYIKGDNGFRMSLDGSSVIDHWTTDWDVQTTSQPITLTAGLHDLAVDYNQGNGGAYLHTEWSGPGFDRRPVPDSALHLPAGFAPADAKGAVDRTGRTATVTLPSAVSSLPAGAASHLAVLAGGTLWSARVAKDPRNTSRLVITPGDSDTPIPLNAEVRISYDGRGGITTARGALGPFSIVAQNDSTWYFATKWAKEVSPSNALPEYPRPQLTRQQWQNLNGTWQFQATEQGAALPSGRLSGKILVPYPMESALSGVAEHHDWSLYQRTFTVPSGWQVGSGNRLHLNFGAVDYEAWVYVNGRQVAHHTGGYEAFTADITAAVTKRGSQTLLVRVKDTTDGNSYAVGKQSSDPSGIWYTPTSGIWQTVWMEPVPEASIDSLVLTPNLADSSLSVTVRPAAGTSPKAKVTATVYAGRKAVGSVSGTAGAALRVPIGKPRLWSPDDPYLYDLQVTLADGRAKDTVGSYAGMRSIAVAQVGGVNKVRLNGKPTFVLATLDQGFWPDGLYTAPTDAALKSDLVQHKNLGFNAVRKHIKVEPARWYYWADRLGLMVWQDMPSRAPGAPSTPETDRVFIDQVHTIVDQHLSSPSIVIWTMMNEGWGEWSKAATGDLVDAVKKQDPSRLVDAHSGVNCCLSKGDSGRGDLIDHHDYHGPAGPAPDATRAAVDGEHGGYSLTVPGHIANVPGGQNYGDVPNSEELTQAYVANTRKLIQGASCGLSGSVYTQIADVEGEINGLLTYDRKVVKVAPGPVREVNRQVIAAGAAAGGTTVRPGTPGAAGVGWWPLHQQSGTVAPDLAGRHDGTLHGGAGWTSGPNGGALLLDGKTGYVDTGAPVLDTEQGDYSVAAWVRLDDKGHFSTAVSVDGDADSAFYLQYSQADKRFAFSFAGARALAGSIGEPQTGRWYHLAGSYSHRDGALRVYVDGAEAGTTRACNAEVSSGHLLIGRGRYHGSAVDYWTGAVSDVHAYDRALSAAEVASLAAREPAAPSGR